MKVTRRDVVGGAGVLAFQAIAGGEPARAETDMNNLPFAAMAPTHVSKVGIKAKDADQLSKYYTDVVGLRELSRKGQTVVLGAGDTPLLEIEQAAAIRADDPSSAGLYHTAFLLPRRVDLARWAKRAIDQRTPIVGASDHVVSEAIYLTDPEGNGIEIYADRPHESWKWNGSSVQMGTAALDVGNLLGELKPDTAEWTGAPDGAMVGHLHLRVGNAGEAEEWWHRELGMQTVAGVGGSAVFLSTGGYHHHVAANSWQSRGAGKRDNDRSGLAWAEFVSVDAKDEREIVDPWGNVMRIVPGKSFG
ncbi:VOC family protein [Phyllobacterium meliloti]|uniref:VOC family protein n=1 Tax=Phyllobacterium meliloti TaxID=555317 RepID=UPI000DD7D713|nr:VOC family protein [Phyllobacterium sp. T1293]UGX86974.1 VOC family protein [Phyllobacterium sp. T1293]